MSSFYAYKFKIFILNSKSQNRYIVLLPSPPPNMHQNYNKVIYISYTFSFIAVIKQYCHLDTNLFCIPFFNTNNYIFNGLLILH